MFAITRVWHLVSSNLFKNLNRTMSVANEEVNSLKRKSDENVAEAEIKRLKNEDDNAETKTTPNIRVKYNKYAMLLSYNGVGYFGMQINLDIPTIEREILIALRKVNLIDDEDVKKPGQKISLQRAARTDKNVSAVKQICSIKLPRNEENFKNQVETICKNLPESIKVWGFLRSTKGFDAKRACDNRSYSYLCPTFAFARADEKTDETFRISNERLEEINKLLLMFKGTHNFYNFTSQRKSDDKSCVRFIISFECGQPFVRDDLEFVTIKIRGQSFMLHQIRKMIGVVISVIRGFVDKAYIEKAFSPKERQDVPRAPGLGLVLEEVHFDSYNKRYSTTHEKISWESYQSDLDKFREDYIDSAIVKTEKTEKPMLGWLDSLKMHTFDVMPDGTTEPMSPSPQEIIDSQKETSSNEHNDVADNVKNEEKIVAENELV